MPWCTHTSYVARKHIIMRVRFAVRFRHVKYILANLVQRLLHGMSAAHSRAAFTRRLWTGEEYLFLGLLVKRVQVPDSACRLSTAKEQAICNNWGSEKITDMNQLRALLVDYY